MANPGSPIRQQSFLNLHCLDGNRWTLTGSLIVQICMAFCKLPSQVRTYINIYYTFLHILLLIGNRFQSEFTLTKET